jgi:hypothetical protein
MMRKRMLLVLCVAAMVMSTAYGFAEESALTSSSYWTRVIHEENSITASILYLPVMVLEIPVRIIDGILYPKPTSQCPIPPPAHAAQK